MSLQRGSEHWFRFRDACVFTLECSPEALKTADQTHVPSPRSIFFLHGRFGQVEIWDPVIEELSEQFRCIAIDLPGFGRSFLVRERSFSLLEQAVLVEELVSKFRSSDGKAVLVGHEFGGVLAQLCALRHPEKVMGLVLINSALLTRSLMRIGPGIFGCLAKSKLRKMLNRANSMEPIFKTVLLSPWSHSHSTRTLCQSFKALEESWPLLYERKEWRKALQNIAQPVLLLWGGNDFLAPPDMGAEMVQRLPDAHFFVHEQAGHWPSLEQPHWVLAKMKEYLFKIGFESPLMSVNVQKVLLR